MFYGRTLWYHSVTANHPTKRHVSKETSATPHMRHLHVKRGQYSQRMSVMSIMTRYECWNLLVPYIKIQQKLLKSSVFISKQVNCVRICCLRCSTLWCYGRTFWYHSMAVNKTARRRIPKRTSATTHMWHIHVTCRRYNLNTTLWES